MCLAILIKPTSIHLGLALVLLSFQKFGWRAIVNRKLMAFAVISLVPSALYYIHAMGLFFTYGNTFGVIAGGDSKWTSVQQFLSAHFYKEILRMSMLQTVGVVGSVLALIGFLAHSQREWRNFSWAWLISFAIYCLILGRSTGDEGRGLQYHIFAAPLMALATAAGLYLFIRRGTTAGFWITGALCLVILGSEARADYDILNRHIDHSQYEAGLRLAQLSRPDERIIVLSRDPVIDNGRQNNYEEPRVFFYSKRWGRSLGRDEQTANGLNGILSSGAQWL